MPKIVFGNFYVHRNYLHTLPTSLQKLVEKGQEFLPPNCQWNIVRTNPVGQDLTFAFYPNFDINPHPELESWTKVDLMKKNAKSGLGSKENPFILHHLESFVDPSHSSFSKLKSLSLEEERAGLFTTKHGSLIGRKKYWEELLKNKGLKIEHYQLKETVIDNSRRGSNIQGELFTFGETANSNSSLKMSGKTAMYRSGPALPARILVERQMLKLTDKIFDWGCGRGVDLEYFRQSGFIAEGWDPVHRVEKPPEKYPPGSFNWVYCGYVLNTLPHQKDREEILQKIFDFLPNDGHLALAARSLKEIESLYKPTWRRFNDGWITSRNTFQKGFEKEELIKLLTLQKFKLPTVIDESLLLIIVQK